MGASLELIGVTRTYRRGGQEIPVLVGIDMAVAPGQRVAIMGRSGSGKSTLLNVIGCLDVPTSGRYLFDGRDVSALDDDALSALRLSSIGFVFQQFHLLTSMTIHENVALPMEYARVPLDEQRERAAELLALVGLSHRLEHTPHELSGGERQRVAIARALANRPQLLLADEPTGALDSKAQDNILSLFADVHQRFQTTMVVVTHDERVAQAMGDRVLHMSDGRFSP
jgi:ABC-type lipoprotein export system ATPase subunit